MSEQLRVLLVDDTPMLGDAVREYLRAAQNELGRQTLLQATDKFETVQRWIREEGRTWDIALVDLDFRTGNYTGLAVLDLLSAMPTPPTPVLFTEPYDPGRFLCCIAAVAWFDVAAAYNKIGSFDDPEADKKRFATLLRQLIEQRPSSTMLPNYLHSNTVQEAFRDLFSSPTDLAKWAALATEEKNDVAAAVAHVSPRTMEGFVLSKTEPVRSFWAVVMERMKADTDGRGIVVPATLTAQIATGVAFPVVHGFAASQILFFRDPYVQERASRLRGDVHAQKSWRG